MVPHKRKLVTLGCGQQISRLIPWYLFKYHWDFVSYKLKALHPHIIESNFRFTMVVVAIAGGTGGVGRTVVDAIARVGEHKAIVLSRTVSSLMF